MPRAPHQSFRIWGPYGPKTGMIVAASSAGGHLSDPLYVGAYRLPLITTKQQDYPSASEQGGEEVGVTGRAECSFGAVVEGMEI